MSEKKDLVRALELAWDLECGISWYDVENHKKELAYLRWKYKVDPFDVTDKDFQDDVGVRTTGSTVNRYIDVRKRDGT